MKWIKVKDKLPPVSTLLYMWDGKEVSEWSIPANFKEDLIAFLEKYKITAWQIKHVPPAPYPESEEEWKESVAESRRELPPLKIKNMMQVIKDAHEWGAKEFSQGSTLTIEESFQEFIKDFKIKQ